MSAVSSGDPYVYFPTGTVNDGKMFALAGAQGTSTLTGSITLKLATSSTSSALDLAVFDGDSGGIWDQCTGLVTYTLFEDGNADGLASPGETQVSQWTSASMADNAWSMLTSGGTIGGTPINPGAYANSAAPSGLSGVTVSPVPDCRQQPGQLYCDRQQWLLLVHQRRQRHLLRPVHAAVRILVLAAECGRRQLPGQRPERLDG
jgi:hypothetical protein